MNSWIKNWCKPGVRFHGWCSCMALFAPLLFCFHVRADENQPTVVMGSKRFTEGVILGEILTQLARASGADGKHLAELGGTQIVYKALLEGEIDAYVEYTGTIGQEILTGQAIRDEADMRAGLEKRAIRMSSRLGFNNTYALGTRTEYAEKHGLRAISDLARLPRSRWGFSDEFMNRKDGWPGLRARYTLSHDPVGMDHTLAYRGLVAGDIDVTDLYSTDAEIPYYKLRVLEDDRGYFPRYEAVILYRADLEQRAPGVVAAISRLQGAIDNSTMSRLNARAQIDREPETRVAAEFLHQQWGIAIDLPVESAWSPYIQAARYLVSRTGEHLFLVAISLVAAIAIAVPLGVLAHKVSKLGNIILASVSIIQTLPSMALLVFMIPFLGLGPKPAIVALFLYSLLPIVRNTYTGLQEIPNPLRESALVLGLPAWARLRWIELPMASRSILAGIKTAAVINVGTATIGALIGAGGYGQPILTGIRLDDLNLILQGAIPAALLALVVQGLFSILEQHFVPLGLRLPTA